MHLTLTFFYILWIKFSSINCQLERYQFLRCSYENTDLKDEEQLGLYFNAGSDLDQCSRYCYFLNRITFGMTDHGYCLCSNVNYDIYGVYESNLCQNPCKGTHNYVDNFKCGGNYVYVTYYRTCPAFTYGHGCNRFCFCRSSICEPLNGMCLEKGCLDGFKDTSFSDSFSYCYTKNCENLNGPCQKHCLEPNFRPLYLEKFCECESGYYLNLKKFSCDDINECYEKEQEDCELCENTPGSYRCSCIKGHEPYIFDGKRHCSVPVELSDPCNQCESYQECVILQGRVACVCPYGESRPGDCYVKSHCSQMHFCHICEEIDNHVHCSCMNGYKLVDHYVCLDIDECAISPCEGCINFHGSHLCQCKHGCTCKNGFEKCSKNTSFFNNYNVYGASMQEPISPILWDKPFKIGVYYSMDLTSLMHTKFYWRFPFNNTRKTTGPQVKMRGKGKYLGKVVFEVAFKFQEKFQKPKFMMNIVKPVFSRLLGQPVMYKGIGDKLVVLIENSAISHRRKRLKCNTNSLPCHKISKNKTLEGSCDLDKYFVKMNDTLFGIFIENITDILPANSNSMRYSMYFEEIDHLQRSVACEMITIVTERVKTSTNKFLCPNCSEYLNRKQNLKIMFENDNVGEEYFYYWKLTDGKFEYTSCGRNKNVFELEKKYLSSIFSIEQNLLLKVTNLKDKKFSSVHIYNFKGHQMYSTPQPCSYKLTHESDSHPKIIISSETKISLSCVPLSSNSCTVDLYIGKCRSFDDMTWLYSNSQCKKLDVKDLFVFAAPISESFHCVYFLELTKTNSYLQKFYLKIIHKKPDSTWLLNNLLQLSTDPSPFIKIIFLTEYFNILSEDECRKSAAEVIFPVKSFMAEKDSNMRIVRRTLIDQLALLAEKVENFHHIYTLMSCAVSGTNHHKNFLSSDLTVLNKKIEKIFSHNLYLPRNNIDQSSFVQNTTLKEVLSFFVKYLSNYVRIYVKSFEEEEHKKGKKLEIHEITIVEETIDIFFNFVEKNNLINEFFKTDYANYVLYEDRHNATKGSLIEIDMFSTFGFSIKLRKPFDNFRIKFMEYNIFKKIDNDILVLMHPIKIEYLPPADMAYPNDYHELAFNVLSDKRSVNFNGTNRFSPLVAIKTNILVLSPATRFQVKIEIRMINEFDEANDVDFYFYTCPPFVTYYTFSEFNYWCFLNFQSKFNFLKEANENSEFMISYKKNIGERVILVIFFENLSGLINFKVSLTVDKLCCLTRNSGIKWENETCEIMNEDLVKDKLICKCEQALMYSGYMVTLNTRLYLRAGEKHTTTGFKCVMVGWILFALILVYAIKKDFEHILMTIPIDLADNAPKAQFSYLIIVETGSVFNMGAHREIFLQLNGSTGDSVVCCLSCNIFQVLKRGQTNFFILRSSVSLGHVLILRLWHRGTDSVSNWFVNNIKVIDLQTKMTYYFICQGWVGTNNKEWRSSLIAILQTADDFRTRKHLLPHNILRMFQFRHRVMSIFCMASSVTLTRCDRAIILLFLYLYVFAASADIFGTDSTIKDHYTSFFGINTYQYSISYLIVLSCVPVIYTIEIILTFCKWYAGNILIIKDSCLLDKTMETEDGIDYSKVTWKIRKKVLRPVFNEENSKSPNLLNREAKNFLRLMFFHKLISPGFLIVLLFSFSLSIFASDRYNRMRHDFALTSLQIFGFSFVYYIFFSHFLALIFELIVYTFILKIENVSIKLKLSKLYQTCRQEYRNFYAPEVNAVKTRRMALDYTIPKRNQFIIFTKRNRFHVRTKRFKELDFLVTCLICFFLLLAEYYDVSGNNSNIYGTNINMIRTLNPHSLNSKMLSKEECFDWMRKVSYNEVYGEVIKKEQLEFSKYPKVYITYDGRRYDTLNPSRGESYIRELNNDNKSNNSTENSLKNETNDENENERSAPFVDYIQTRNPDVYLVKPICFWKVNGEGDYGMVIEDTITPSFEHICTNFTKEATSAALDHIEINSWLHRKIQGISVKLIFYTSNVNTYSVVTMGCKTHSGKGIEGSFKVCWVLT